MTENSSEDPSQNSRAIWLWAIIGAALRHQTGLVGLPAASTSGATGALNESGGPAESMPAEFVALLREQGLLGVASRVLSPDALSILGIPFQQQVEVDQRVTEVLLTDLYWVFGPRLGQQMVPMGGTAMRPFYEGLGQGDFNPRLVRRLVLWTPTMSIREEALRAIADAGYDGVKDPATEYLFRKSTLDVSHEVQLKSNLWEASKSWSSDLERDVWNRLLHTGQTIALKLDLTDLFLLNLRHFGVDRHCGRAVNLLDLALQLDQSNRFMEWDRLKELKSRFGRSEWFSVGFAALANLKKRTSLSFEWPTWIEDLLREEVDPFMAGFVDGQMNWIGSKLSATDKTRAINRLKKGS